MTMLYLVRHCRAAGQEPDAPLTPEGEAQAVALADLFAPLGIDRIVSSPYRRALASVEPLAARLGLPIETDDRLVERVLSGAPVADWRERLRASFGDPALCLPGGESGAAALARGRAALEQARRTGAERVVVVTHGNMLSLLLADLDGREGFGAWERLSNPDAFQVDVGEPAQVTRVWRG